MKNNDPKNILNPTFRITKIRAGIIKCISDTHHSHTFDDIVSHLKNCEKLFTINFASIYNTLNLLINEGIIFARIDNVTQKTNYEIMNSKFMHYHIYNIDTKKEFTHILPPELNDKLLSLIYDENEEVLNVDLNIMVRSKNRKSDI